MIINRKMTTTFIKNYEEKKDYTDMIVEKDIMNTNDYTLYQLYPVARKLPLTKFDFASVFEFIYYQLEMWSGSPLINQIVFSLFPKQMIGKPESCGAMLYTFDKFGRIGLVLGSEFNPSRNKNMWYPFKGVVEGKETREEAAIREVDEETSGLVIIKNINLTFFHETSLKKYFIGLHYVNYSVIDMFNLSLNNEEKLKLGFFPIQTIFTNTNIPPLTKHCVEFFLFQLNEIESHQKRLNTRLTLNKPIKTKMCNYEKFCKNNKCSFAHSFSELNLLKCKFGINCRFKDTCKFIHLT